ncbi:unnamed protein product [Larinioides sclopetarius]|uniref:GOLD domain-containing protein n=1 Tax=Larinioides sclopetarius TaxID=280406 RepID=A0AAV2BHY0_9ARAC
MPEATMLFLPVFTGLLMVSGTEAFYFYLKDGDEKCFIRELPDKTLLIAHYRCQAISKESEKEKHSLQISSKENRMMVEVRNPQNKIVLSREYRFEGSFSFTSHEPGEHTICMHTKDFKSYGRALYREEMFRESTDTISRRILMWSVAQTVVLIVVGVWQMQSFRKFIESKKLV